MICHHNTARILNRKNKKQFMLTRFAQYFVATWKDRTPTVAFVEDFSGSAHSELAPFDNSEDEAIQVSCSRSEGTVSLVAPRDQCWRFAGEIGPLSADINVDGNELSWRVDKEFDIPSTELGSSRLAVAYDNDSGAGGLTLKVGPLASRVVIAPKAACGCGDLNHHHAQGMNDRYLVTSNISVVFPLTTEPNTGPTTMSTDESQDSALNPVRVLRCGLEMSNDPDIRNRVGVSLDDETQGWNASIAVPLVKPKDFSMEDVVLVSAQMSFRDGDVLLTGVGAMSLPARAAEGDFAVRAKLDKYFSFPTSGRFGLNTSGRIGAGVTVGLVDLTVSLGAHWQPGEPSVKFGLSLDC